MSTFHLVIATVGEALYDNAASSVTLPGSDGEFTVLANHEPFVTTLKPGTIRVKNDEKAEQEFQVPGGVVECANSRVTVLL